MITNVFTVGHMSRECPKPKDWSRVKCQNCGEMGHGKARCPNPSNDDGGFDSGIGDGDFGTGNDGGGGSFEAPNATVEGGWDSGPGAGGW